MREAFSYVKIFCRCPIQELTLDLYDAAARIHGNGGLYWQDALIVAATRTQGCDIPCSVDMQDGRIIDRLRIVNPLA